MMASPRRPVHRVSAQTVCSKVAVRTDSSKINVTEAGIVGCGGGAVVKRGTLTSPQAVVRHKAAPNTAATGAATTREIIRLRYPIESSDTTRMLRKTALHGSLRSRCFVNILPAQTLDASAPTPAA